MNKQYGSIFLALVFVIIAPSQVAKAITPAPTVAPTRTRPPVSTVTPTPRVACTAVSCPKPGILVCRAADGCPGGCGTICDSSVTRIKYSCNISVVINNAIKGFPSGRACTAELKVKTANVERSQLASCMVPNGSTACSVSVDLRGANSVVKEVHLAPSNLSEEESLQLGIIIKKGSPISSVSTSTGDVAVSYQYLAP